MIDKDVYLKKINQFHQIMEKHGLSEVASGTEDQLVTAIRDYEFRILLVGGFSAGKSAFLNTLLDRQNLLTERQGPETALAAELKYDTEEYIEAVSETGNCVRYPIMESSKFSPEDWRYLVYHLNNDYLREHKDIVLVDMPGLDSNREWHDRSIAQYIARGSAFLLLVSCENGTLMESTADFLREFAQYPQGISCFLTKTDLKTEAEYTKTLKTVEAAIRSCYQADVPVVPVSVMDDDFAQKADKAIAAFDPQAIFMNKFKAEFQQLVLVGHSALQKSLDAVDLNFSDLDQKIQECSREKKRLQRRLEHESGEQKRRYMLDKLPTIQSEMESALQSQVTQLAQAAKTSPEVFDSLVNSILRPVILQITQESVEGSFENYAKMVEDEFNENRGAEIQQSVTDALRILSSSLQGIKERYGSSERNGKSEDDIRGFKKVYTCVTGALAIATDFINPAIELIIVALPHVLSWLGHFSQQEKERELEQRLQNETIPMLVSQLMPQMEEMVGNVCDDMLQEMKSKIEEVIEAQEQAMNQAREEKKSRTIQFENKKEQYAQDIARLEQMLKEME